MSFPRSDFRYFERLRVRWAEVDMQSIVFNGHYLMYFDTAVAGYWRALALPYHETMAYLGGDFYVRKSTLEYEGFGALRRPDRSRRAHRNARATRRWCWRVRCSAVNSCWSAAN